MNSSPSWEERWDHDEFFALVGGEVFLRCRLRQQLDEEGFHVPVGLSPAERIKPKGHGRVFGAQHAQLLAALGMPDDEGVAAHLVVEKGSQAHAERARDLQQWSQRRIDIFFLDQADQLGLETGPLLQLREAQPLVAHDGFDALPDFFGFHMRPLAANMVAKKEMVYTLDERHVKEKKRPGPTGRAWPGGSLTDRGGALRNAT